MSKNLTKIIFPALFFSASQFCVLGQVDERQFDIRDIDTRQVNTALTMIYSRQAVDISDLNGTYYSSDFQSFKTKGFSFSRLKPEEEAGNYEIRVESDGAIAVKDLTKVYRCGNGILFIESCSITEQDGDVLTIHFHGQYTLEHNFDFIGRYVLKTVNDANFLELMDVVKDVKTDF
jgi:hypothetical protein